MKKLLKLSALALFALVGAFVFTSVNPSLAIAQDSEEPAQESSEQSSEEQTEESGNSYTFTAQSGDSFTKIARKSVQIYGIDNDVNLSEAQIVAAETFLTSDAGFPALDLGQSVSISEDTVKAAVEKAEALDEAAVARWQSYVPYVDFNTDNVGESQE